MKNILSRMVLSLGCCLIVGWAAVIPATAFSFSEAPQAQVLAYFLPQSTQPPGEGDTAQPVYTATPPYNLYSQTATPGIDNGIRHTVLEGQFLITIAELYGIPLDRLLSLNSLTIDSIILPGDILVIVPGGEINLGQIAEEIVQNTVTPSAASETNLPTQTGQSPQVVEETPIKRESIFKRVFSSEAKYLAFGIIALVLMGIVLLIISSRRIQ